MAIIKAATAFGKGVTKLVVVQKKSRKSENPNLQAITTVAMDWYTTTTGLPVTDINPTNTTTEFEHDHQHGNSFCTNGLDETGLKCADKAAKSDGMDIGDLIGLASVAVVVISILAALFWKISDYALTQQCSRNRRLSFSYYGEDFQRITVPETYSCLPCCSRIEKIKKRVLNIADNTSNGSEASPIQNSKKNRSKQHVFWQGASAPAHDPSTSTQGDAQPIANLDSSQRNNMQRYIRNCSNNNCQAAMTVKSSSTGNFSVNASDIAGASRSMTLESFVSTSSVANPAGQVFRSLQNEDSAGDESIFSQQPSNFDSLYGRLSERLGSTGTTASAGPRFRSDSFNLVRSPLSTTTALTVDQLILQKKINSMNKPAPSPLLVAATRLLAETAANRNNPNFSTGDGSGSELDLPSSSAFRPFKNTCSGRVMRSSDDSPSPPCLYHQPAPVDSMIRTYRQEGSFTKTARGASSFDPGALSK